MFVKKKTAASRDYTTHRSSLAKPDPSTQTNTDMASCKLLNFGLSLLFLEHGGHQLALQWTVFASSTYISDQQAQTLPGE